MTAAANYFPEDYDRADHVDIVDVADLRPFLAHVLGPHSPAARRKFLRDLEDAAEEMASLADLTGPQLLLLETVRLEDGVVVTGKHRRTAEALAAAGLATVTDDGEVALAPPAEGS